MPGSFWYYVAYIQNPELLATCAKATLTGNIGGTADLMAQLEKPRVSRLREYTMQDWIAVSLPYMIALAIPVISSSYVYDPCMKLLLYAAFPSHVQNWATFGLCLLEELRFLTIMATIVTPLWQLQVISFDLVCKLLQMLVQAVQKSIQSPRNMYRTLRRLQLYVSMLNNLNGDLIFTWKLLSTTVSIVCGYAAIAHFHEHPVFGIMYYFILFDCVVTYTVIYEKAFKVPQLFDEAASCALLRMRRGKTDALDRRQILSIPCTGIRIGHFHQMERTSTLIFMNYVITNVVSMLVAFR